MLKFLKNTFPQQPSTLSNNTTLLNQQRYISVQPGRFKCLVKTSDNIILDTDHFCAKIKPDFYQCKTYEIIGSLTHTKRNNTLYSLSSQDYLNNNKIQYIEYHKVEKSQIKNHFIDTAVDSPSNLFFKKESIIKLIDEKSKQFTGIPEDAD